MILYYLVLSVHIAVCLVLVTIILVQGGRGGLGETLGGGAAQSLFGGGTSTVIAKLTAFSGGAFMITCLTLAMLSTARGKSVIEQVPAALPGVLAPPFENPAPMVPVSTEAPAASEAPAAAQEAVSNAVESVAVPAVPVAEPAAAAVPDANPVSSSPAGQ